MSSFYTTYRKISNTPKDKFQYLKILIRLIQINKSTINNFSIKTKTPNEMRRSNPTNVYWKILWSINAKKIYENIISRNFFDYLKR